MNTPIIVFCLATAVAICACTVGSRKTPETCYRSLVNPFIETAVSSDERAVNEAAIAALASLGFVQEGNRFKRPGQDCFVALERKSDTVLVIARYRDGSSTENPDQFDKRMRAALARATTESGTQNDVEIGSEVTLID